MTHNAIRSVIIFKYDSIKIPFVNDTTSTWNRFHWIIYVCYLFLAGPGKVAQVNPSIRLSRLPCDFNSGVSFQVYFRCNGITMFSGSPIKCRQHPDMTKAVQLTGTQRNIQKQHAPHEEVPLSICNKLLDCAVLCFTSSSLMCM